MCTGPKRAFVPGFRTIKLHQVLLVGRDLERSLDARLAFGPCATRRWHDASLRRSRRASPLPPTVVTVAPFSPHPCQGEQPLRCLRLIPTTKAP
ncbi:BQ5605_C007g04511 [Microbotryum silenes-dioicae]|uniref:BQ5605_C007g04511 protein n=1 Tax=Microbotryum silenes-dioicae TaxID=796604 RepID=A0A2X0N1D8_9BASI|nr:BQ5605_C007g04511 [Microbotryum silenes-dioicae]